MEYNHPHILECIRLIQKFFPESKSFISVEKGIDFYRFVASMSFAKLEQDYSCNPHNSDHNLGLDKKGGFDGADNIIFLRLLEHSEFHPKGRAIVIPDAMGKGNYRSSIIPFICAYDNLLPRLFESDIFMNCYDTIFVFESGECFAVDHDNHFYWAKSIIK